MNWWGWCFGWEREGVKGIILVGGVGVWFYLMVVVVSKQLLSIYGKSMIYYLLLVLVLAWYRDWETVWLGGCGIVCCPVIVVFVID